MLADCPVGCVRIILHNLQIEATCRQYFTICIGFELQHTLLTGLIGWGMFYRNSYFHRAILTSVYPYPGYEYGRLRELGEHSELFGHGVGAVEKAVPEPE